jgi:DNA-directed RNA polymerase subunit omega
MALWMVAGLVFSEGRNRWRAALTTVVPVARKLCKSNGFGERVVGDDITDYLGDAAGGCKRAFGKYVLLSTGIRLFSPARINISENALNSELTKKALEKVGNPNVLINLVSRRVRQLNAGGGGLGRPLVEVHPGMGLADVALTEIIEEKIGFDLPEPVAAVRPTPKKRKKHH